MGKTLGFLIIIWAGSSRALGIGMTTTQSASLVWPHTVNLKMMQRNFGLALKI